MTSTWKEQLRGCPHGSSLGPLLWNIFQNDLPLNVHTSNLFIYADDHQVYQSGSDSAAIISELTNEAENVSRWYRANLLRANPKKYQVLVIFFFFFVFFCLNHVFIYSQENRKKKNHLQYSRENYNTLENTIEYAQ